MVSIEVTFSIPLSFPFRFEELGWSKPTSTQGPALFHLIRSHIRRITTSLLSHLGSLRESERGLTSVTGDKSDETEFQDKESGSESPILRRWKVPWQWQTVLLTPLAFELGFVLTDLIKAAALSYLGIRYDELSLDGKSKLIFVEDSITTAVVLGVIFGITNKYQPRSEDFFKYDWRELFNLQKGWLLWAGIGLAGHVIATGLTLAADMYFFGCETIKNEPGPYDYLLPLIGSSNVSTACLVGSLGALTSLHEEIEFRGFLMASLTKWYSFFNLHTPPQYPYVFVLGTILGILYARTHNLLTPITVHALWNSGIILILTIIKLQGYDLEDLMMEET